MSLATSYAPQYQTYHEHNHLPREGFQMERLTHDFYRPSYTDELYPHHQSHQHQSPLQPCSSPYSQAVYRSSPTEDSAASTGTASDTSSFFHQGWPFKTPTPPSTNSRFLSDNSTNKILRFATNDVYSDSSSVYGQRGGVLVAADYTGMLVAIDGTGLPLQGRGRVVKRRVSANRKERRRTHSINSAFSALRGCIPNVPSDTKLSKIKTLRLATSYIAYLMDILNKDDPKLAEGGFKAEITKKFESREEKRKRETEEILKVSGSEKLGKGRTGWPQQVWAAELQQ